MEFKYFVIASTRPSTVGIRRKKRKKEIIVKMVI